MTPLAETILVSKLRKTAVIGNAQIEQIFDVINAPGMVVICVSGLDEDGELAPISQVYEVAGLQYGDIDSALLAWDDARQQRQEKAS